MINAFLYPLSSITWLAKRELRSAVLIPLLINMVLFVALAWLGSHYFDVFLNQWLPADTSWAWLLPLLWLLAVMMFLGPLAMPSATIGATRYWLNQLKD